LPSAGHPQAGTRPTTGRLQDGRSQPLSYGNGASGESRTRTAALKGRPLCLSSYGGKILAGPAGGTPASGYPTHDPHDSDVVPCRSATTGWGVPRDSNSLPQGHKLRCCRYTRDTRQRVRDSNPRRAVNPLQFSKLPHSTAMRPLCSGDHGTRTHNPLRGNCLPSSSLTIRIVSRAVDTGIEPVSLAATCVRGRTFTNSGSPPWR
jgi:hypothetical protein